MLTTKPHAANSIRATAIVSAERNQSVIESFFAGIASCDYHDGRSHQLYLDTRTDTLSEHLDASDNSWLQRNDGSLIRVLTVSGYSDIPEGERYTGDGSLDDYGYGAWRDELEDTIARRLSQP